MIDQGLWTDTISIKQWTEITIPITNTTSEIDSAYININAASTSATAHFWVDDLFFK